MMKKVLVSGLAGAVIFVAWAFVLNGILGFNARLGMKQVPDEAQVHEMLKTKIIEPGQYICNPALTSDSRFPENEPVFGIRYSGVGHEAAGFGMILGLIQFLVMPLIGAWMLSKTSELFRARFINRVLFLVMIGLLVAIAGDLGSFGIGGSPLTVALIFAVRTIAAWTIVGLAIAAIMRPELK